MKTIFRFLRVIVCLCAAMEPMNAQWVQSNGPFGGYVNTLAVSGTTTYAGLASGSIYR